MAIDPLWLQNITYPARLDRTAYDAIWTEGVMLSGDFQVTQSSPTAMTVRVAAGIATVTGDDQTTQGKYLVRNDGLITGVAIGAAPGSGQRNDLVVLKVRDQNAGVGTNNDAVIQVIAGTPSSTPVDPAIPATALVLARVRVPAGTSSITTSLIDDLRVRAVSNYDFIADGTITSAKIADGTLVNADISASAAIALSKLAVGALPSGITVNASNFANNTIPSEAVFTIPGIVTTGAKNIRYYCETPRSVANVVVSVGTAPTGSSMIFDVNKNGTTIFTTQANRPSIAASGFYDGSSVPDVTSFAAGDYITIDVDQVGSSVSGSNAVVKIVFG